MWIALRVGVFYAVPVVAVAIAVAYFAVLMLRVRRGAIDGKKAAFRYASMLLLPIVVILMIWGAGELSSYLASPDDFRWDTEASQSFLLSLLPIGVYVGAPIAALVVAFWLAAKPSR